MVAALARMVALMVAVAACGRSTPGRPAPLEELEALLPPAALARALGKAGGGRYHATLTMDLTPTGGEGAGVRDAITTTTDLWLDKQGHFRLVETNDRDGGREIIAHDRDLAIGMRHGRLIRRPLQQAEALRYLHEALGGATTVWEVARRFAEVTRREENGAAGATVLEIGKAAEPQSIRGDMESGSVLQKWRDSINVQTLAGQIRIDGPTLVPTKIKMEARFTAERDGTPLTGIVKVDADLRELGQTRPIEPPQAEELQTRQRTILEERALLGRTGAEGARR